MNANKAIFNCANQSKYYNDTFQKNPPRTQIGNDVENITIQYQNSSYPFLQFGDVILNSSRKIVLNAPVIRFNGTTIQNQGLTYTNQ